MEELEATPILNEENQLEVEKQRVLLWIDWRVSNLPTIKARMTEMEEEEAWCSKCLGIENIRQALDLEFLENVLFQKYVDLNQRTTAKGKGIAEADKAANVGDDDNFLTVMMMTIMMLHLKKPKEGLS